jgi:hypothetical protein
MKTAQEYLDSMKKMRFELYYQTDKELYRCYL